MDKAKPEGNLIGGAKLERKASLAGRAKTAGKANLVGKGKARRQGKFGWKGKDRRQGKPDWKCSCLSYCCFQKTKPEGKANLRRPWTWLAGSLAGPGLAVWPGARCHPPWQT